MKTTTKKSLQKGAILLAILLLLESLSVLTACSNEEASKTVDQTTVTDAEQNEAVIEELTDGLEDINMEGYEFNILATEMAWTRAKYDAEQDGEPINDAISTRNRYLEERFNCDIVVLSDTAHASAMNKATNDVQSDDGVFDMVSLYDVYISVMLPYIADWNNVSQLKLDKPWWNPDATVVYNWGGKQCTINGYTSLTAISSTNAIAFNKDMLKTLNVESKELYDRVRNGSWTLDAMYAYGKQAITDLNGDSKIDLKDDRFAIQDGNSIKNLVNAAVASAGIRYVGYDANHNPVYQFDNEKSINMYQKLIEKSFNEGVLITNAANPDRGTSVPIFLENRALFVHASMLGMETVRGVDQFDIGILPFPKFDETVDDYRSLSVGSATCFLPRTVSPDDYDRIGTLLEAMAFYSYYEVLPVYKEIALKTKSTRDNESSDMLDIIFNTICFDLGHTLEHIVTKPLIAAAFLKKDSTLVASSIEANKEVIRAEIEKLLEAAKDIF